MKEQEIQENMNKSIEATQRNFNTIRQAELMLHC